MQRRNPYLRVSALVLLLALCFSTAALAQDDLSETFVSEDGSFSFDYPEGWDAVEQEPGKAILSHDDITMTFYGPGFVADIVDADPDDLETTLASFLDAGGMSPENLDSTDLGDRELALADIESLVGIGIAFGMAFDKDGVGAITVVMPEDSFDEFGPTMMDIVESFGPAEAGSGDAGSTLAGAIQAAAQAGTNVNCTVSTDQERFASVRVGPGTNRTAMLFLPADRDFRVEGQAAADDGALWWKLDKAQVAPNTGASELWVDQNQVIAGADCDRVPNVEPPPVIPIVAVTDTLPTPGTWNFTAPSMRINCPGLGTLTVETDIPPFRVSVNVLEGGSVLTMDSNRFNRSQPGTYIGQVFDPDLGSATYTIRVVSTNRMEGEFTGSIEGCSFAVGLSLTR